MVRRSTLPADWPREGAWLVVRLADRIGGTRNGQEWPDVGSEVLLPVLEALDLVRTHLATSVETVDDTSAVVVMR